MGEEISRSPNLCTIVIAKYVIFCIDSRPSNSVGTILLIMKTEKMK